MCEHEDWKSLQEAEKKAENKDKKMKKKKTTNGKKKKADIKRLLEKAHGSKLKPYTTYELDSSSTQL